MKPFYLPLLFCSIFILKIDAQHLEIGNKWIYDHRYHLGAGHYIEKIDSMEIVGEETINDLSYFKIVSSEEHPCGVFTTTEYLREEDGKIYRLDGSQVSESLLIDYSTDQNYQLNYESAWQNDLIETNVVQDSSVVEVLPNGTSINVRYQRIINNSSFDDNAVYKLVDRVGYTQYGFLFPNIGTGLCDPEESINFRCFISQNETIHFTELDCYESSIKVSTKNIAVEEIIVSPNPSSGLVSLPGNFDFAKIYDTTGKVLNVNIDDSTIDLSGFENGFYMLQLRKNNEEVVYTSKLIKI